MVYGCRTQAEVEMEFEITEERDSNACRSQIFIFYETR